ncbi:MAG: ABC transporter permease subunit [Clostridiales bacterium]|nr:ABC transporter permease subunit [Clostridiales bacterium]
MNALIYMYKNELYKLFSKKKYIVFLIIASLFCLLRYGGSALVARLSEGNVRLEGNIILEMLPFFCEIMVPVMIFTASVELFTSEYSSDTMKACLLHPASRFKVLTAKFLAVFTLGAVSLIAMYIVCVLVQLISGGSLSSAPITLAAYVIDIIPLIAVTALGVLINVVLRSPSAAMLLSLAVYAAMKCAGRYVAGSSSVLFTSYSKLHTLFLGSALPLSSIIYKLGILLGSILILYSLSYIIYDSKDI